MREIRLWAHRLLEEVRFWLTLPLLLKDVLAEADELERERSGEE